MCKTAWHLRSWDGAFECEHWRQDLLCARAAVLKAAADTLMEEASQRGPRGTLPLVIEFEDLPGARFCVI